MVDTVAIIFSTLACLFFMLQAARADRAGGDRAAGQEAQRPARPEASAEPATWSPAWDEQSSAHELW